MRAPDTPGILKPKRSWQNVRDAAGSDTLLVQWLHPRSASSPRRGDGSGAGQRFPSGPGSAAAPRIL